MVEKIGVMMGGFTAERHISLESGRNIYNKLVASSQYDPLPLFLSGSPHIHRIFILPIFLLLKDNADDVHEMLLYPQKFKEWVDLLEPVRAEACLLTQAYAQGSMLYPEECTYAVLKERVDFVFLALHGRPGEDGSVQAILEQYAIPYNGSGVATSALAIDKYATSQFLKQQGFYVPKQLLLTKEDWYKDQAACVEAIERRCAYPLIAKPVDEGCSTGVVKITSRSMLYAYILTSFEPGQAMSAEGNKCTLQEDIPKQSCILLESFILQDQSIKCIEVTTGLLTHIGKEGTTVYEIFESSEVLAAGSVLSLEEKFLAGEGHNITPARFHSDPQVVRKISQAVKEQLTHVASVLNLQGYARIDAFVKVYANQKVEVWIIEVNTLPAMTPATCIFHQCALNGYTPFDFMDKIIQYGLWRVRDEHDFKLT